MESQSLNQELIVEAAKEFKSHLEIKHNKRILFSGKYGKGKTTFLFEFFRNQNTYLGHEKYIPIFLDPVHYSVASNEDIFRYIKYDILLSLIERSVAIEDIEFTTNEAASYFFWKHPEQAILPLIEFIPKVGKTVSSLVEKLAVLYGKVSSFKEEINKVPEAAQTIDFLDTIHANSTSLYESDTITHIIQNLIHRDKTHCNKEYVLIIDNLDRIDPEHIFRILNIFSAHMDFHKPSGTENKFGFDKIILVCDLHNVRSIFWGKYGRDVDFTGYINKFYSDDIFYFKNYRQIFSVARNRVSSIPIKINGDRHPLELARFIEQNDHGIFRILQGLIYRNILSLRQILNATSDSLDLDNAVASLEHGTVSIADYTPILEMKVLSKLVGGYTSLRDGIKQLQTVNFRINKLEDYFKKLLYFDIREHHLFRPSPQKHIETTIDNQSVHLIFSTGNTGEFHVEITTDFPMNEKEYRPTSASFYTLYLKIMEDLHQEKVIE